MLLVFTIYILSRKKAMIVTMCMLSAILLGGQVRASSLDEAVQALDNGHYQDARKAFEALAETGNTDAQTLLGIMYSEGRGVGRDNVQARHWLLVASHQGCHEAQFLLGLSYLTGQEDPAQSRIWLRRAAHNGNPLAQRFLVRAYRNAWFGSENRKHASYWQARLKNIN